jgi:catechol 2,3-dioxygenase-like lactoylglutathione lyase family enzyme
MIGYVTLGSNDFERAKSFYDALLAELGAKQVMATERMAMWGTERGAPMLGVCTPFDAQPATIGNGGMVALQVESPEAVARLHAKAIELGGSDEGAPGPRGTGGFNGGYFRDLDGNKLLVFHRG